MARIAGHGFLVALLTLLTQIGGIVWLLSTWAARRRALGGRARLAVFLGLYSVATLAANLTAPVFGREPLPCFLGGSANLSVRSPMFCALNRNYVTPDLRRAAEALADHMAKAFPGTKTLALDANFPFLDGFPLLPHLSHQDGRKLDLAFYYDDEAGEFRNGETRSPVGYFAFERPGEGSPQPCARSRTGLSLRWDLAWLQPLFPDWRPDAPRMREALRWLSSEGPSNRIEKVFIEPHLAARYGGAGALVRFQGCRAARHDDHLHIQVRKG
jgi:hypothetical protein